MDALSVRRTNSPSDIAAVKRLFLDYLAFVEDFLGSSLDFQDTETEFRDFPQTYDALFLATLGGEPAGACGLKPFGAHDGELKRLWVCPSARGHALGRRLTEAAIAAAKSKGYERLLLDTNAGLIHANALYEALGFEDIASYYDNPMGDSSRYMALKL